MADTAGADALQTDSAHTGSAQTDSAQTDSAAAAAQTGSAHADAPQTDSAAYTAAMREMWGLGDYTGLAGRLAPAAAVLVETIAPAPGARVLDLAAGTGNVAVLASARRAAVVAADLSPRMVELGRARTQAGGLDVEWFEADAEALPFPDDRFDAVLSAFGLIFVARPQVALAELRRVLVPGGVIGFTAWSQSGFVGEMTTLMDRWLPPTPGVAAMLDWGRREVLDSWAGPSGVEIVAVEPATLSWRFDSPAAMSTFFRAHSPGHQAAAAALGERANEMFAAVEELAGPPGVPVQLDADYLVVTARAAS